MYGSDSINFEYLVFLFIYEPVCCWDVLNGVGTRWDVRVLAMVACCFMLGLVGGGCYGSSRVRSA